MTREEAVAAISEALRLGLSGAEFMRDLGPARVAAACNGCGPERFPETLRDLMSRWLSLYALPFAEHDCRFEWCNDGSDLGFRSANNELERNCLIVADARYGWWNPLRYVARHRGRLIAEACRRFGWPAWRDAYNKHRNEGETR